MCIELGIYLPQRNSVSWYDFPLADFNIKPKTDPSSSEEDPKRTPAHCFQHPLILSIFQILKLRMKVIAVMISQYMKFKVDLKGRNAIYSSRTIPHNSQWTFHFLAAVYFLRERILLFVWEMDTWFRTDERGKGKSWLSFYPDENLIIELITKSFGSFSSYLPGWKNNGAWMESH